MINYFRKHLKSHNDLCGKKSEYNRLIAQKSVIPPKPMFVGVEKPYDNREFIIWRIDCTDPVYMQIEANSSMYIVYIDTVKFYINWLKSSLEKYDDMFSCPLKIDMHNDRKYHWSVQSFSHGRSNPVPLAEPVSNVEGLLSFEDGITRTLYLIKNNAPSFPVATFSLENAILLNQYFGLTKDPLTTSEIKG